MRPKPIKVTKDQIRGTAAFKKLNDINQKTILRKENVEKIQHGVNVSSNIGFANWEAQSFPRTQIKNIAFELLCILKIAEVMDVHPDPLRDERAFLVVDLICSNDVDSSKRQYWKYVRIALERLF